MIELYTWTTPNGEKPVIMLEELGLDYALRLIDISTGKQKESDFLAINPNGRIPALRDDGVRVFESGAILLHLAEKTGRLLAPAGAARAEALGWMFFQAGGTGPMIGQIHYFKNADERSDFAIRRFEKESDRLLGVLDKRLGEVEYLAGEFSVADVMNVSWARSGLKDLNAHEKFPALAAWVQRVDERPAVARALGKLKAAKDALTS
ncbi:glutathione S-transferase family protein [Aureimonas phyllosphaerae]|uniref:GST-like protein n=1 Tax=Aureimonas phyllosphaerae TaxID=1166078 RepID=A0A7W6BVB6_9HYPH|nr:glutathione S-transferase N-terminal domain-containing protein [Aureimonas phyllosphaerae]MBB3934406.1 GST-like protein [Aureimonas phyllosphaerae]MBB3958378.1 GST-like protein [Aureimonas phyllosphaerae]SFE96096.1 GST-like protein [Aureimonas phyllosphaerae]